MVDVSTVGIVSVPDRSTWGAFCRELSEDVSFSIGALLVVEQSSFENRPVYGGVSTVLRVGRKVTPSGTDMLGFGPWPWLVIVLNWVRFSSRALLWNHDVLLFCFVSRACKTILLVLCARVGVLLRSNRLSLLKLTCVLCCF